ncbi:MAG: Uma2 family endonuclease [Bacteroidota bacterium]
MKFKDLDLSKSYTYADYLTWNFFERIELIRGKIFRMSPAPSRYHQEVLGDLYFLIKRFFISRGNCRVYIAPFDVRLLLPPHEVKDEDIDTVVQPDICIFCNRKNLDERGAIGPPDWVIEILSPSTAKKDKTYKYDLYEFAGVKEYWIFDPVNKSLTIYSLDEKEKRYWKVGTFSTNQIVQPILFPELDIDLQDIMPDVDLVEEAWDDVPDDAYGSRCIRM